jgi:hypothetical protein
MGKCSMLRYVYRYHNISPLLLTTSLSGDTVGTRSLIAPNNTVFEPIMATRDAYDGKTQE